MRKIITVHSYAKLNLYLEVLGRRKDRYHEIKTLFERISLSDKIILKNLPDNKKISVSSNLSSLPGGSSNLAYKAAHLLQQAYGITAGVDIKIAKHIPVGSGMGGGSSNAAATLLGLNKLWGINAGIKELAGLAAKVGSDVPFFIYDTPFALGEGRGERITPIRALDKCRFRHIIVVPRINVSTPSIYKQWDRLNLRKNAPIGRLTIKKNNVKILTSALRKNDLALVGKSIFNSLEKATASIYAEINEVKEKLARPGVKAVLMSGSGPTVFCFVLSKKEVAKVCRQLKRDASLQVFVASTR